MAPSIFWLRVAACFYAVGLVHAILVLLRHRSGLFPFARAAFRVGAILHAVAIVDLTMQEGSPVGNAFQTVSLCAFLIATVSLAVEWRYAFSANAVAHYPLVFLMTLAATLESPFAASQRMRDMWLVVHIVLILVGYAALFLTAVASICYLLQERRLKAKQTASWFEKLPPLATLDEITGKSMVFCFVFMTLGVVVAFIQSGTSLIGDSRVTLSLITWVLLLVTIFLRASAGWRGRRAALMTIAVVCGSALTWIAHAGLESSAR